MIENNIDRSFLTRYAWLSIAVALLTIALKAGAFLLTGSVGLLSDALESIVNLVGALTALAMLSIAARPADESHAYGHSKAEYFSSGVEGTLILIAALSIGITAVERLINPRALEQIGLGLTASVIASLANLVVAMILMRAGKRYYSITLQANSRHLMTDVWTSVGVLAGVGLVAVTGWQRLDPIVALFVAANIVRSGVGILRSSIAGLMDVTLPADEQDAIRKVLEVHRQAGVEYHALRTRQSGAMKFISLHVLVPGDWSVHRGHRLLGEIEADISKTLPNVAVFTHLESLHDPSAWDDVPLNGSKTTSAETAIENNTERQ